jgi:hypothetical protein
LNRKQTKNLFLKNKRSLVNCGCSFPILFNDIFQTTENGIRSCDHPMITRLYTTDMNKTMKTYFLNDRENIVSQWPGFSFLSIFDSMASFINCRWQVTWLIVYPCVWTDWNILTQLVTAQEIILIFSVLFFFILVINVLHTRTNCLWQHVRTGQMTQVSDNYVTEVIIYRLITFNCKLIYTEIF